MHRFSLLLAASLVVAGCFNDTPPINPNDGAIHLVDLGHSNPYGSSKTATSKASTPTISGGGGGRYASTIDALAMQLRDRWAHRELHEEIDGVDVEAVLAALRDESEAASDRDGFRAAIDRALCRLGDGGLRQFKDLGPPSDTGLSVRAVGSALIVEQVDGRYSSGLGPGDLILSVDGHAVSDWVAGRCVLGGSTPAHRMSLQAQALEHAYKGGSPRPTNITVRRAKSGKTSKVELKWKRADRPACVEGRELASNVGVVVVNRLNCKPDAFEQGLDQAITAASREHVLLDLRRVRGNDEENAKRVAERFAANSSVWATTRAGTTGAFENEPLSPKGTPVAGQRWLLISARCSGACEMLASVVASDGRVPTVGRTTAGSVTRPEAVKIGKGVRITIPSTQFALPDTDVLIEARGITPDLEVTATIDELARGRDPEVVAVARRMRDEGQ